MPDRVDRMSADAIKEFFPDLSDVELQHARENLDLYLELAWEIYEDMQPAGSGELDAFALPGQDSEERSIPQIN